MEQIIITAHNYNFMEFADLKYLFVGFGFTVGNFILVYLRRKDIDTAFRESWGYWAVALSIWSMELGYRYLT